MTLSLTKILVLMIPVVTGLSAALWSRLVKESFVLVPLVTCIYSACLVIILLLAGYEMPRSAGLHPLTLIVYAGASIFVVWAWMMVAKTNSGEFDATPVALAEMAWPVFTALFMWLLFGIWSLTPIKLCGAALSLIGLLIIALAS
jgi:drug/metabolite transporter (DMT)-like permease